MFVKKKLPEQLGLHCYAVNTHPDELVLEPPPKKIMDPSMNLDKKVKIADLALMRLKPFRCIVN